MTNNAERQNQGQLVIEIVHYTTTVTDLEVPQRVGVILGVRKNKGYLLLLFFSSHI